MKSLWTKLESLSTAGLLVMSLITAFVSAVVAITIFKTTVNDLAKEIAGIHQEVAAERTNIVQIDIKLGIDPTPLLSSSDLAMQQPCHNIRPIP